MEHSAICHFADARFCFALEKDRFLFRIRVKKGDVRRVILHCQDKYLPLRVHDTRRAVVMSLAARDSVSDYYEAVIELHVVCLRYFFELEGTDAETVYYGNYEFSAKPFTDIERMFDCPQNLREEERFTVPAWARNKVVYQVFPASFAPEGAADERRWYKSPIDHREDLGGTLRGIIDRMDHIKELGADVLYMTPVFKSMTVHKYDTVDYYRVDPSLGTKEDLKELVDKAHSMGLRVILDGVFNHSSQEFFAFADIKERGERSEYLDWYFIEGFPLKMAWGTKPNFKTFSYYGGMPKLNLRNPAVEEYFINVGLYWIRECGIDGWRLDVADEVGHRFWRRFREAIKAEKPDALIVGEEWHYGGDFLQGDEWDTVMNYHFYNSVTDLIAGEGMTVSGFFESLGFLRGNLHTRVYELLWNLIGSHDTKRFIRAVGGNKAKMRMAAALQLLLPGMPMIYYGDEYAMDGGEGGDCRRGMVWDKKRQDLTMFDWYKRLIAIRHDHPCLTEGKITSFSTDDASGTAAITTHLDGEELTVLLHCGDGEVRYDGYEGRPDLVTGAGFTGILGPWDTAVLGKENDRSIGAVLRSEIELISLE